MFHKKIIEITKSIGYKADISSGCCYGLSRMAAQTFLTGSYAKFLATLLDACLISASQIQTLKEGKMSDDIPLSNGHNLKKHDLLAVCDGITLFQTPKAYATTLRFGKFNQRADPAKHLLMPSSLSDANAKIIKKGPITAVLNQKEIAFLLVILQRYLLCNTAIQVSSSNHTVSLLYHAPKKSWYLFDANKGSLGPFTSLETLACHLVDSFSPPSDKTIILSMDFLVRLRHKPLLNRFFSLLKQSQYFTRLVHRSLSKARYLDHNGYTWLHCAARNGDIHAAEDLLKLGAGIDLKDCNGSTPLWYAAYEGHPNIVNLLLEKEADCHAAHNKKVSPLMIASRQGHDGIVGTLLAHGADTNQISEAGVSALLYATKYSQPLSMFLLLAYGADINTQHKKQSPPLIIAAAEGHTEVTKLLLEAGADCHMTDDNGNTPLHLAMSLGHVEVASLLLKNGANYLAQNARGDSPFSIAMYSPLTTIRELIAPIQARIPIVIPTVYFFPPPVRGGAAAEVPFSQEGYTPK